VVTGAISVGLTKIPKSDRAIHGGDNFRESNVCSGSCENITATYTTLAFHQACAFKGQKNLLKVWLRETCALGDIAHTGWARRFLM
jgi:hypothetical protein